MEDRFRTTSTQVMEPELRRPRPVAATAAGALSRQTWAAALSLMTSGWRQERFRPPGSTRR